MVATESIPHSPRLCEVGDGKLNSHRRKITFGGSGEARRRGVRCGLVCIAAALQPVSEIAGHEMRTSDRVIATSGGQAPRGVWKNGHVVLQAVTGVAERVVILPYSCRQTDGVDRRHYQEIRF